MATVQAFIRVSAKKTDKANIRFRLRDGRNVQFFHKSEIEVSPDDFDNKKQTLKSQKDFQPNGFRDKFNDSITDRKKLILKVYNNETNKAGLTSEILDLRIDKILNPDKYKKVEAVENTGQSFFDIFDEFLLKHKLSEGRKSHYEVIFRALKRFELYTSKKIRKSFILDLSTLTADTLRDIEHYLTNEVDILLKNPEFIKAIPQSRQPKQKGKNTISGQFTKIRAFIHWAIKEGITSNNPFNKFTIEPTIYGTPYYITIDERNRLYNKDLSFMPELAIQRDIYVFQCFIGCRVSDMYSMTKENVIDGFIEYIQSKSKDEEPQTVRVPLSKTAIEILNRYPDNKNDMLLPFISQPHYNKAIRDAFTLAGLKRMVTVLNPTTRKEEKKPLNEIASSHVARRTLIGNLYKQGKDQNLISSITGHKEGSKAFARYRNVDDEMKTDLINLLD